MLKNNEIFNILDLLSRMDPILMVSHCSQPHNIIADVFPHNSKHIGMVLSANNGAKPFSKYS